MTLPGPQYQCVRSCPIMYATCQTRCIGGFNDDATFGISHQHTMLVLDQPAALYDG